MGKKRRLEDQYRFPGFRPDPTVRGIFGDPKARIRHCECTDGEQQAAILNIGVVAPEQARHDCSGEGGFEIRDLTRRDPKKNKHSRGQC